MQESSIANQDSATLRPDKVAPVWGDICDCSVDVPPLCFMVP